MSISQNLSRISFCSAAILAAVIVMGHLALMTWLEVGPVRAAISDLINIAVGGLSAAILFYAARKSKAYGRRVYFAWLLLGLAQACTATGDAIWMFTEIILKEEPFPSVADVPYLMFYPLFALGILLFPHEPLKYRERFKLMLDTGIVTISAFMITWIYLLKPTIEQSSEGDMMLLVLSAAYPFLDCVLIFALTQLLFRNSYRSLQDPISLLIAGTVATIAFDLLFSFQNLHGIYVSGSWVDSIWVLSHSILGLAAVLQLKRQQNFDSSTYLSYSPPHYILRDLAFYLPYLGVLAAVLRLAFADYNPKPFETSLIELGAGIVLFMLLIRQIITIKDNTKLNTEVLAELSERKKFEEALQKKNFELDSFIDNIPDLAWLKDVNSNFIAANRAFGDAVGKDPNYLTNQTCEVCFGPEAAKRFKEDDKRVMESGIQMIIEECILDAKGNQISLETIKSPIFDASGIAVGTVGVSRNITERKRMEEALAKSEARYRAIVEDQTELVCRSLPDGVLTFVNEAYCRYFGKKKEELIGSSFMPLIPHDDLEMAKEQFLSLGQEKPVATCEHRVCANGKIRWTEWTDRAIFDGNGRIIEIQSVGRDITARKEAQEEVQRLNDELEARVVQRTAQLEAANRQLNEEMEERKLAEQTAKESEGKYHQLVDTLQEGIWAIDQDGYTTFVNPRMAEMLGYTAEEMLGRHLFSFTGVGETGISRADLEDKLQDIKKQHEFEFLRKNGNRIYVTLEIGPLFDGQGNCIGALAGITDITERKLAEDKLRASLAEKDMLIKEVHHRVKNNMQVISSLLNLQSEGIQDEKALEMFKESQNRVKSMAKIHERLYKSEDLSRIDFAEYIQALTGELLRSYNYTSGSDGIRLKIKVHDVFLGIDSAIPCGLIINELVSNALKHAFPASRKGEINIDFHPVESNGYTLIVRDNGIGFPADLDFKATESLGLRLVYALITQLRGTIELNRSSGTEFIISFPQLKY